MKNLLQEAMRASVTFNVVGDSTSAKKLAFLPGVYSTQKQTTDSTSKETVVSYNDPSNLVNAGYQCDQVADDNISGAGGNAVVVSGANRVRYRDFLNTVQRVGIRVYRIIIQNKATGANASDIFDQEIEISRTAIGAKGPTDFIQLQNYVSVNAYDRSKIEIDLSDGSLYLGPETFMAMNIPANANFSIQFCFEA